MEMVKKCEKYGRKINAWSGISISVKRIFIFREYDKGALLRNNGENLKEIKWKASFFG